MIVNCSGRSESKHLLGIGSPLDDHLQIRIKDVLKWVDLQLELFGIKKGIHGGSVVQKQ